VKLPPVALPTVALCVSIGAAAALKPAAARVSAAPSIVAEVGAAAKMMTHGSALGLAAIGLVNVSTALLFILQLICKTPKHKISIILKIPDNGFFI
jgi:hypothetical protein